MTNLIVRMIVEDKWSWSAMTGMQWDISAKLTREKKEEKETLTVTDQR